MSALRPSNTSTKISGNVKVSREKLKARLERRAGSFNSAWYLLEALWRARDPKTGVTTIANAALAEGRVPGNRFAPIGLGNGSYSATKRALARLYKAGLLECLGESAGRWMRRVRGAPAEGNLGAEGVVFVPDATRAWLESRDGSGRKPGDKRKQDLITRDQRGKFNTSARLSRNLGPAFKSVSDEDHRGIALGGSAEKKKPVQDRRKPVQGHRRKPGHLSNSGSVILPRDLLGTSFLETAVDEAPPAAPFASLSREENETASTPHPDGGLLVADPPPSPTSPDTAGPPQPDVKQKGVALLVSGDGVAEGTDQPESTPLGLILRSSGPPRRPFLPTTNFPGIPPYPSSELLPSASIPDPPLLDEAMSAEERAHRLADAYRGAIRDRFGADSFRLRQGPIQRSKFFNTLVGGAAELLKAEMAPAAWAAWCCDLWKQYNDDKKPPPVVWVFSPKRILERRGWFQREESSYMGGRRLMAPKTRALLDHYMKMRWAIHREEKWDAPEEVVARYFPGDTFDRALKAAKAETARQAAELRAAADTGSFLW